MADPINRDRFQKTALLALAIGISLLFLKMIGAFLMALLLAAIFAGLTHPLYRRLLGPFRGRRNVAAAAVMVIVLLLIVGPLSAFLGIVVVQAVEVSRSVRPWVQQQIDDPSQLQRYIDRIPYLAELAPYRDDMLAKAGEIAGNVATFVANKAAAGARGTAQFLLALFVMLYSMFFFLRDGPGLLQKFLYYLPLSSEDEDRLLERFTSVTRATIKGTLLIGILQGFLTGAAFAIAGIKGSVFWGTVVAVLSIIPGVGGALVWIPAVVYLAIVDRTVAAIAVGVWCAVAVGSVDNVLRPRLVGQDTKMSDVVILVSTLGGIAMFGAAGIIIGPIIAALFITVWELYGVAFRDLLTPADFGARADESRPERTP